MNASLNEGTTTPAASPRLSDRLLGLACYLGFAPLVRCCLLRCRSGTSSPLLRFRRADSFVAYHYAQAMAGIFLALAASLVFCLLDQLTFMVAIRLPLTEDQFVRWNTWATYVELVFLAMVLGWMILLLGRALAGCTRPLPLLERLTRRPWIIRLTAWANVLGLALVPLTVLLAFHATSLTRAYSESPAAVYFLYDKGIEVDGIRIPRWAYALGLYRVSLQARRNWGASSVVLDRLDRETLRGAFAQGKVVILATHGEDGYACTYYSPEELWVGPPPPGATDGTNGARFVRMSVLPYDWASWRRMREGKWEKWDNVPAGGDLRLVYLFGCYTGKKAAQWEEHLSPARVICHNRPSDPIFDHAIWFALTGPAQLKRLQ